MDQLNPAARSDEYGSRINRTHSRTLAFIIPVATVLLGSFLAAFPLSTGVPLTPPLGFLIFLAWRFTRPGHFPVWAGFPFGLFDDLFSGQPFGSAALLWSLAMIALEFIELRFPWRNFVQDWMTAALIIAIYLIASSVLSGGEPNIHGLLAVLPQVLLSAMLFPIIARMVARLDRLRLLRIRKIR